MQAQDRYKTILVIVTGLLALSLAFNTPLLIKISLAVGIVSVFVTPAARAIEWLWLKLALMLGWINSRILLSVIYFLFLLPLAWFSRLFTKDTLKLKRTTHGSSVFHIRNYRYSKKDLENIW